MKIQVDHRFCLLFVLFIVHQSGEIGASQGFSKKHDAMTVGDRFKSWLPWFMGYANSKPIVTQPLSATVNKSVTVNKKEWPSWLKSCLPDRGMDVGLGSDPSSLNGKSAVVLSVGCQIIPVKKVLQQNSEVLWDEVEGKQISPIPELLWTNVRKEDGANCGYHALKNLILMLEALKQDLNSEPSEILVSIDKEGNMSSRVSLLSLLSEWVPKIYAIRSKALLKLLSQFGIKNLSSESLKKERGRILDPLLRSYINLNDGHIKTEMLDALEMQLLVNAVPGLLPKDILVINDQYARVLMGSDKEIQTALNFIDDENEQDILKRARDRIVQFNRSAVDTLGVLWTEKGFNHWVAYVVQKRGGRVVHIYYMNSIVDKDPKLTRSFFELVGGTICLN